MATAFLRVSGRPDDVFPCEEETCVLCRVGDGSTVVHGEPLDAARALARELGVAVPALLELQRRPIGHDAPAGRRYGVDELPRAIAALEALFTAAPVSVGTSEMIEARQQELTRALAVFRAGHRHGRAVMLEV